jgi:RNase P subunit RPR2
MKIKDILKAEKECLRFLDKLKEVKVRMKDDKYTLYGCKETGALKRSSLDLTRSLSVMRNPVY